MSQSKTIGLRLPVDQLQVLDDFAEMHGRTRSGMVRELIIAISEGRLSIKPRANAFTEGNFL